MESATQLLSSRLGSYEGKGINHENQEFNGVFTLLPQIDKKGFSIDFSATGLDGTVYHKEHSIIGPTLDGALALWVMSTNHPGIMEHRLALGVRSSAEKDSFSFQMGDPGNGSSFRETIELDLWKNGDLTYQYSWGMPGGEFKERSVVRLLNGRNRLIQEAKLVQTEKGIVPAGEGWYVLNAKKARWSSSEIFGDFCGFEGDARFQQYGINIHVLYPGKPNCHYHGEDDQENFLVIRGKCKLFIEGQERELGPWDFVHCPKWTRHVFVGSGSEPCTVLMVGGRTGHGVIYPVIEAGRKYQACAREETDSPKVSYAHIPEYKKVSAPQEVLSG